jgi:hypothetical protein
MELYTPSDYQALEPKGTCGLATLAVLQEKTVQWVLNEWNRIIGPYHFIGEKGSGANLGPMLDLMRSWGWELKRHRGLRARVLPRGEKPIIARIQWLREDGTEYFWREAPIHTHYVLIIKDMIFANEYGWIARGSKEELDYLKLGFVSSYVEIIEMTK